MKKIQIIALFFLLFTSILISSSCKDDPVDEFDCAGITFSNDIAPIIASKCATTGCHVSGFMFGDYTTYDGLQDDAQDGTMEQEVIIDKTMPQVGTLTQDELEKFQCWFDDGAPNN